MSSDKFTHWSLCPKQEAESLAALETSLHLFVVTPKCPDYLQGNHCFDVNGSFVCA